jgi:hypothetical protein
MLQFSSEKFKQVMVATGKDVLDISLETRVSPFTLYKLRDGSRDNPAFNLVCKIAASLGVRLEDLADDVPLQMSQHVPSQEVLHA